MKHVTRRKFLKYSMVASFTLAKPFSHVRGANNDIRAAVVGFLAWRLKFDKDDKVILSGKIWLRYLQNAVAAIIGMGLVTGETIGLLRVVFLQSNWVAGNIIATSIFYSN